MLHTIVRESDVIFNMFKKVTKKRLCVSETMEWNVSEVMEWNVKL